MSCSANREKSNVVEIGQQKDSEDNHQPPQADKENRENDIQRALLLR